MAQVIQQIQQQTSPTSESKGVLARTLENLLERYLHLLHQYQTLQQDLCHRLSRVCFYYVEKFDHGTFAYFDQGLYRSGPG